MDKISKHNQRLLLAIEKGYSINKQGDVLNKNGKIVKGYIDQTGYKSISIRDVKSRVSRCLRVHKIQAYQKYGDKIFEDGILIRHLNGNNLDNSWDNILIGSQRDNMFDIPKKERLSHSIHAASKLRKFTDDEIFDIIKFHSECKSYKKTMGNFNISSKGTLNYILKNKYKTKK